MRDLTGQTFGRLTAVRFDHYGIGYQPFWFVRCECGTECTRQMAPLLAGKSTSCGCLRREKLRAAATGKHHRRRHSPKGPPLES